jgi:hypothetical protein
MTPKEKAKELFDKFYQPIFDIDFGINILHFEKRYEVAKQCALIAVNEILLSSPFEPVDTDWDEAGGSALYWYPQKLKDSAKWWDEVKQEIEEL